MLYSVESVDLPPKIDSNDVTFNEKDYNKNLLELNEQDMKLCQENACFVNPATSFLTKNDTTCSI